MNTVLLYTIASGVYIFLTKKHIHPWKEKLIEEEKKKNQFNSFKLTEF